MVEVYPFHGKMRREMDNGVFAQKASEHPGLLMLETAVALVEVKS